MRLGRARKASGGPRTLITESEPRSPAAEAYRTLRTNIQFAGLDARCRSIVITSATAGEGKTTSAANFGVVSAQAGSRICLVDSDLRRPALHRTFGVDNKRGLTTALLEGLAFATIAQPTRIPNLWLLPSGPLPPNPAELVASKRMRELLEGAAADYDMVICDSPPVIAVSDGVNLSAQCDGVIMTVRVGMVAHEVVRRAIEQIEAVKGRILGVLLNSVNLNRDGYYYPYYRYYQSYNGHESKI